MSQIEFTDNYQDLSTDNGFQFKFFCQGCGNGYMSSWQANKLGVATRFPARAPAALLGGVFGGQPRGLTRSRRPSGGPRTIRRSKKPWRR